MTFSPNLVTSSTTRERALGSETTPILRRMGENQMREEREDEDHPGRVSLPILGSSSNLECNYAMQV